MTGRTTRGDQRGGERGRSGPESPAPARRTRLLRLVVVAALGIVVGVGIYLGDGILTTPRPIDAPGWSTVAEMPEPRGETAVASTASRLYVIGGMTGLGFAASASVSILDAATEAWIAGPPLPEPRHHAAAAAVGDTVYLAGGASPDGAPSEDVWVLHPGAAAWEPVAPMPVGRMGHRMVAVGDRLYVVGGVAGPAGPAAGDPDALARGVLVYDTVADAWSVASPMPLVRDHLAAVVVDGEIWAIGGRAGGLNHARVDIYDPVADAWRDGIPLPEPTSGAAEAIVAGKILLSGGEDPFKGMIVDRHWFLDSRAGAAATWMELARPPLTVHGAPGGDLRGRFVIAGGASRAAGQSNTAWTGITQVLLELP
ncbi:MAG TPA: kelch repeat-containing protein [Candidatus Binatia bacterium]|nr:kelch repeat-containing protein [Candidatus Binatia bacterium]